jgi:hypothetical protein
VVRKPAPQNVSAREFEISQIRRRYNPVPLAGEGGGSGDDESSSSSSNRFEINLRPSDPDFVYAIDVLRIVLVVPAGYRSSEGEEGEELPEIEVRNDDIPVGYRVNVERGFREMAKRRGRAATLLDLLEALDRDLEKLLSGEKAETVKIVPNLNKVPPATPPPPTSLELTETANPRPRISASVAAPAVTAELRAAASAKRTRELRQLEARLQLSDVFSKSADGTAFVVPLEPRRKELLPVPIHSARLIVPLDYNLQPARIELPGVPEEVRRRIERRFEDFVMGNKDVSLTATLNILATRLHVWASAEEDGKTDVVPQERKVLELRPGIAATAEGAKPADSAALDSVDDPGKSHVKHIPQPPEWSFPDTDEASDTDGYSDPEDDGSEHEGQAPKEEGTSTHGNVPHSIQERGTSLSCPGMHMSGIELLEVLSLNVNIKCTRCKAEREVVGLRGTPLGMDSKPRVFACEICSAGLGVGFRKDFIHQNSHRLG